MFLQWCSVLNDSLIRLLCVCVHSMLKLNLTVYTIILQEQRDFELAKTLEGPIEDPLNDLGS